MKKRLLLLVALLVVCAVGFVIAKKLLTPDSGLTKLRVAYMPIAECGPLFLGIDHGFFREEGLEIEVKQAPGGAVILESILGGSIDVGFSNLVSVALARSEGIDLVAFAGSTFEDAAHPLHGLVVPSGSPIREPSDLRGKTIALNTRRNVDHLMLVRWLRSNGVSPDEIKLVEVPFPRMETVLKDGGAQAGAIVEPFLVHAKNEGLRVVGNYFLPSSNSRVEVTSYAAQREWLVKNDSAAKSFAAALRRSIQYSLEHESELRETIAKWTKVDTALTARMGLPGFSDIPSSAGVEVLLKDMLEEGFLKNALRSSDIVRATSP